MHILTNDELKILKLLTMGMNNSKIGRHIYSSRHTVKIYVQSIIEKMGASCRAEASYLAGKMNLV